MIAASDGREEVADVGGDDCGIEPELGGAEQELFFAQLSANGVGNLVEGAAAALLVAIGPELEEEADAAYPLLAPGRDARD